MKKKILALLLAALTVFAAVLPASAAAPLFGSPSKFVSAYASEDEGMPVPDYTKIVRIIRDYKKLMYDLTGLEKYQVKIFDFEVDDTLQGINDSLLDQTGLNFSEIYLNLPDTADTAERWSRVFHYDILEVQDKLNAKAKELKENGESFKSAMVRFFSVWLGVIRSVDAVCEPVEGNEDLVRLTAHIIYKDGRTDKLTSDIYYNTATQCFEGPDGKTALMGYDFNVGNATVTTGIDGVHKALGFSFWYDILAKQTNVLMDYKTERIKFNYGGKNWLVQLWKGRYFVSNGGEIGVYSKPQTKLSSFYECDDSNSMEMSLKVSRNGQTIVDLPAQNTWWRAGFKLSNTTYDFDTFHYEATIKLKDADMLAAFLNAVEKNRNISYSVNDLTVTLVWD